MARILAIDYGSKRTGLAVTDPLQIIASPLQGLRTHDVFDFLKDYFQKEDVERVVLGYPLDNKKRPTDSTRLVEAFANRFRKLFPNVPLILHDEWSTSKIAQVGMIESGTSKAKRRDKLAIDQMSATIILQSFLESTIK